MLIENLQNRVTHLQSHLEKRRQQRQEKLKKLWLDFDEGELSSAYMQGQENQIQNEINFLNDLINEYWKMQNG